MDDPARAPVAGTSRRLRSYRPARQAGGTDYLVATTGNGAPVLLLHGFRRRTTAGERCRAGRRAHDVAPDLRGYGGSHAEPGGPHGEGFSKREMAAELVELMEHLGFADFAGG